MMKLGGLAKAISGLSYKLVVPLITGAELYEAVGLSSGVPESDEIPV